MSALTRFCLRLCAVEVIATDAVLASALGGRVYDSEMGAVEQTEPMPLVIVHSETSGGEARSSQNGGPPFDDTVDLVFEIICAAQAVDEAGNPGLFVPATTRELEAALDVIEHRVTQALAYSETPLARAMRRHVLVRILKSHSDRFASDDAGGRLASRLLTLTCQTREVEDEVYIKADELPGGTFARLPEPLRSIAPLFPEGSSAHTTMTIVASQLLQAEAGPEFTGADFAVTPTV